MFGELSKLLDRNFVIGYFLPAVALLAGAWLIFYANCLVSPPGKLEDVNALVDATLSLGVVWLVAVTLLALNRPIIRFIEGYGAWNPLKIWAAVQKRRFKTVAPILHTQTQIDEARAAGAQEPKRKPDHSLQLRKAVQDFPDAERWLLPTRFGNRYRAIEVYSRVVYGLDAIPAWPRLHTLLPKSFRTELAQAEAQLSFAVNLLFASVSLFTLQTILFAAVPSTRTYWIIGAAILLASSVFAWLFYELALASLTGLGEYVRSAFDLYRFDLANGLHLKVPASVDEERTMWTEVSRLLIYRSAAARKRLANFSKDSS